MPIPVIARHNLDAYIPNTEIVVKIPAGKEGEIIEELRNDVVLVNFKIPGLSALRVAVNDLEVQDRFEIMINQMATLPTDKPTTDLVAAHREVAKIMVRVLRYLAEDSNREAVEQFIDKYNTALRWVYTMREKDTKNKK